MHAAREPTSGHLAMFAVGAETENARKSAPSVRADGETRTPDPFITSEVLYQLSYVGGRGWGLGDGRRPLAHPDGSDGGVLGGA